MGLDIIHYKITNETKYDYVPSLKLIEKENFCGYDVESSYFKLYWKYVKKYKKLKSSKYATNKRTFEKASKIWNEWNPNIKVELINMEALKSLKNKSLDKINQKYFLKKEADWYTLDLFEFIEVEGFYLKEIGYQRKGVVNKFFEDFDSSKTGISRYTDRERFLSIYNLIGKYYEHDTDEDTEQLKIQYRRNFLEKYEEGKSILSISY